MILLIEAGAVALLAYWVSTKFPAISFPMAVIGLLGVWFLATKGKGFLSHFTTTGGATAGGGGGGSRKGFFGAIKDFFLMLMVWVGVMMIAVRVTGVSNAYAFYHFDDLGRRVWFWQSHIAIDLILWTCAAFIAGWVATEFGRGNKKVAGWIFGTAAVVTFLLLNMPHTAKNVLPLDASGKLTHASTDTAFSERGVVPVVVDGATTLVGGKSANQEEAGVIPTWWRRFYRYWFGGGGSASSTAQAAPAPSSQAPQARENAPRQEHAKSLPSKIRKMTPTEVTADYAFSLEADAPIMVQYPGQKPFLFTPGDDCSQLPEPQRSGAKKFWDPNDPENGHVSFRIYPGGGRCA
ncbi:MAG: hypothetical protein WAV15_03595 [Minisyncoccia bacterium]